MLGGVSMRDGLVMWGILFQFLWYMMAMAGAVVLIVIFPVLPGWYWWSIALVLGATALLGLAGAMGVGWAERLYRWLTWTRR